MTIPTIRLRQRGATWPLHVTYSDGTTHVPAYDPTQAQARGAQGLLTCRYTQAVAHTPAATVQDLVRLTLDVVRALDQGRASKEAR